MPAGINWRSFWRKWHRWVAVLTALPFLLVIVTGILLQVKKEFTWIQPPTQKGVGKFPTISFDDILAAARTAPEAGVRGWEDIDRLDVQPRRGVVKVQCKNRWEIQIDTETGHVLQTAYRRSDLIESLHDGTWFDDAAKLWIFLPNGLLALSLWLTGMYLFFLPWWVKWRRPTVGPTAR